MSNPQLPDIEASVLTAVRAAYDLGRSDALKKVVAAVNADRLSPEPLALMAPASAVAPESPVPPEPVPPPPLVNGSGRPQETPWWAFPVR